MTAISSKVKSDFNKKVKSLAWPDMVAIGLCFVTGIVSGNARWCDIPMAATAIVLAYCCDDILCRYALVAGAVISSGIVSFGNRAFIAYFLAGIIFIVTDNITGQRKYSLISSAVVIAVGKLFLAYYNLSFSYKRLAVIEATIVYAGAVTAQSGVTVMTSGADNRSFTDIACGLVAVLSAALALSGADSHFLYMGLAFALGLGWFYISNGFISAGAVSFLAGTLVSFDKTGFTYLFISLAALWLIGGFFSERQFFTIYPSVIISAAMANILFISHFNSFALTGSSIVALAVYTLLPHLAVIRISQPQNTFIRGRDWRLLMLSLKRLENSLSFLAGSVIDISRLNEKNTVTQSLEDLVAEDVCRKCEKNHICWQEKYSFTRQQFAEYSRKLHWAGENKFSSGFCTQCINVGGVMNSFEENSRLLLSRKYIAQSQKTNQKLLQNAFLSVSGAVGDLIYQNQRSHLINTTITMEIHRFLGELSIDHSYCLCSQNPDMASFAVLEPVDDKTLYKIQNRLEYLYNTRFTRPQVEQQGTELIYIFNARPVYGYDLSVESNRFKRVNGDNRDIFTWNGSVYAVLSDGMGTGRPAAAESRTVVAMARSLITTGISMKNVIDIINLALNLKGSGENSASVDILQINLSDGSTTITKAGAGVSMVLDRQGVTRYYQDSLPLGILKDVKPVECNFKLGAGDTVILMSDGAGVVSNTIKDMYSDSCNRITTAIIEENKTQDDKTVIAIRLKIDTGV